MRLCISILALLFIGNAAAADKTNLIQQINAHTLKIGEVRLETKDRRIIFPATVNMVEGPIEYLLVSSIGKLHESIFKTAIEPIHLQTAAMLLLKEPGSTNNRPAVDVSVQLPSGKELAGEALIENVAPERRLAGPWRYNGSRLIDGTFLAQRDGSIISIIADPDAIIESGRVDASDDENWRPASQLPLVGTPVTFVLNFK